MTGMQVSFHQHLLFATESGGDAMCMLCRGAIAAGRSRYACETCNQSFCSVCVGNFPLGRVSVAPHHQHPLAVCTAPDAWICCGRLLPDGCRSSASASAATATATATTATFSATTYLPEGRFRCAECEVDMCLDCVVHYSPHSIMTVLHPHPLVKYVCDNGWCCDCSLLPGGCRRGITRFFQSTSITRFRCCRCDFDVCDLDAHAYLQQSSLAAQAPTPPPAQSNAAMVEALVHVGCIRNETVKNAFLRVDRALFLPTDTPAPYSGAPCEVKSPHFYLKSASLYAECLMELSCNILPDMACLVVPPASGYMNALLACLVPNGVSCGIAMTETTIDYARRCTETFLYQSCCRDPIGDIEYIVGNVWQLDRETTSFDRICVDANCATSATVEPLTDFLRIGGLMTVSVHDEMTVYERLAADKVVKRRMRVSFPGKSGTLLPPMQSGDPQPLFQFSSPKVLLRGGEFVSVKPQYQYVNGEPPQSQPQAAPSPSAAPPKVPRRPETLEDFLRSLDLLSCLPVLTAEAVTLESLQLLSDDDMKGMGILLGPRRKILAELERRKNRIDPTNIINQRSVRTLHCVPLRLIGSGSFGSVFRGVWNGTTPVAMKTLSKGGAMTDFESEIQILSSLRHPNICVCFGTARHQGMLYCVQELAQGSVLSLVQDRTDLSFETLCRMAMSCAAGMDYLGSQNIVHRDLAARNLLYFCEDDNATMFRVKVADFGLARIGCEFVDKQGPMPPKWSAIEALERRLFTTMSDVWSFGVVLFELFSHGSEPYAGLDNGAILPLLQRGDRLPRPCDCPKEIYEIMRSCWAKEPTQRPTFVALFHSLIQVSKQEDPCSDTPPPAPNPGHKLYFSVGGVQLPESSSSVSQYWNPRCDVRAADAALPPAPASASDSCEQGYV